MAYETQIKRILYVAKCPICHESVEKLEDPPRDRFCNTCHVWVPYVEESYTGKDLK